MSSHKIVNMSNLETSITKWQKNIIKEKLVIKIFSLKILAIGLRTQNHKAIS